MIRFNSALVSRKGTGGLGLQKSSCSVIRSVLAKWAASFILWHVINLVEQCQHRRENKLLLLVLSIHFWKIYRLSKNSVCCRRPRLTTPQLDACRAGSEDSMFMRESKRCNSMQLLGFWHNWLPFSFYTTAQHMTKIVGLSVWSCTTHNTTMIVSRIIAELSDCHHAFFPASLFAFNTRAPEGQNLDRIWDKYIDLYIMCGILRAVSSLASMTSRPWRTAVAVNHGFFCPDQREWDIRFYY